MVLGTIIGEYAAAVCITINNSRHRLVELICSVYTISNQLHVQATRCWHCLLVGVCFYENIPMCVCIAQEIRSAVHYYSCRAKDRVEMTYKTQLGLFRAMGHNMLILCM